MDRHKHKCGLEHDVFNPKKGCGHVWEHENISLDGASSREYAAAHVCPSCGRGEWRWRYYEDLEVSTEDAVFRRLAQVLSRLVDKEVGK